MRGIQFITDEKGQNTAAVIDLKTHKAVWEDFYDGLVSEQRQSEGSIPFDQYRAERLKKRLPSG